MKSLNRRVKRILMSALSAIAGVSAAGCGGGGGIIEQPPMYGPPWVTVSGKVTQSDGTPIQGIQIEKQGLARHTHTAADGTYTISSPYTASIKIVATDVDGATNGEFNAQTIDLGVINGYTQQLDIVLQPKDSAQ